MSATPGLLGVGPGVLPAEEARHTIPGLRRAPRRLVRRGRRRRSRRPRRRARRRSRAGDRAVLAAPGLLARGPAFLPMLEAGCAVEGRKGRSGGPQALTCGRRRRRLCGGSPQGPRQALDDGLLAPRVGVPREARPVLPHEADADEAQACEQHESREARAALDQQPGASVARRRARGHLPPGAALARLADLLQVLVARVVLPEEPEGRGGLALCRQVRL
mmetsp:Transcript_12045/g.37679  ORF Transcript_12045/g.37679 Transcript_12045/m.37679 type:complete len:219 (-) Transcript_12045:168-824(-)